MRYLAVLLLAFLIATGRAQSTQDGSRATGQNRSLAAVMLQIGGVLRDVAAWDQQVSGQQSAAAL